MTELKLHVDAEVHKKLAADLFNATWDFIEKPNRSEADDETMVHAAHASRFHWGMAGTPLHFARGEWLISRVYALTGRAEPAMFHAEKSLSLCLRHQLNDFDTGFAYEALARACEIQGDAARRDEYLALALQAAQRVERENDRTWLLENIHTVSSGTLPAWD
ncbi:hypothetical protein [Paenibacillus humicola]|uniref:hypothetical protein n=1 Tax=Paenibacillus humicola TaxID=3110540 RepID=UPI00237AAE00|nr:hypothetical protein [Paenibacillus humicola]